MCQAQAPPNLKFRKYSGIILRMRRACVHMILANRSTGYSDFGFVFDDDVAIYDFAMERAILDEPIKFTDQQKADPSSSKIRAVCERLLSECLDFVCHVVRLSHSAEPVHSPVPPPRTSSSRVTRPTPRQEGEIDGEGEGSRRSGPGRGGPVCDPG